MTLTLLALLVTAQVPIVDGADGVIVLQSSEKETVACRYAGRSLSSAGSATVSLRKTKQADASPSSIITTGPTASGTDLTIVLTPDQGCGTAGCRAGNEYQITLLPTDSGGNKPRCDLYLIIQNKVLTR